MRFWTQGKARRVGAGLLPGSLVLSRDRDHVTAVTRVDLYYASVALRVLVLADLPATLVLLPLTIAIALVVKLFGFGLYAIS